MLPDTEQYQILVNRVADLLKRSRRILFITGAGISAESGLPTYRGIGGLYNELPTEEGLPIEELLSGRMMMRNPELTWRYLGQIIERCRDARHNRAHTIIAEMEKRFEGVTVLTQNVDGFHRAAGSGNIIDIHGSIHKIYCPNCSYRPPEVNYHELSLPPRCPSCHFIMRPDVVLFGEYLDMQKISRLSAELQEGFDIIFTIGTTSVFPYISAPVFEGRARGIPTVEINPDQTEVSSYVTVKFSRGAVQVLSDLWQRLNRAK